MTIFYKTKSVSTTNIIIDCTVHLFGSDIDYNVVYLPDGNFWLFWPHRDHLP